MSSWFFGNSKVLNNLSGQLEPEFGHSHSEKAFFLVFKQNFLYFSWGPSPLVHTLDTAEKSPTLSFNLLHQILIDKIPLHFSSPGWAALTLSAFSCVARIQKTVKHVLIRALCWKVTVFHGRRQTCGNSDSGKKKSQYLKIVYKWEIYGLPI